MSLRANRNLRWSLTLALCLLLPLDASLVGCSNEEGARTPQGEGGAGAGDQVAGEAGADRGRDDPSSSGGDDAAGRAGAPGDADDTGGDGDSSGGADTEGSGGADATGGSSDTGGTGGVVEDLASDFAVDGYGQTAEWQGPLITEVVGSGATITPECNDVGTAPCFNYSGDRVCAAGTLALSYESYSRVIWFLNQEQASVDPPGSWTLTGTGVRVDVARDAADRPLIFHISSSAGEHWCANVPDTTPATLQWSDFTEPCYSEGEFTAPATLPSGAIESFALEYLGDEVINVQFDFCIRSISLVE